MNRKILSALIGLMGAVGNNGKTENTDSVVINAILSDDIGDAVEMIHREKYKISPGCASCQTPCGNTSDYDMDKWNLQPEEILEIKEKMISLIVKQVKKEKSKEFPAVSDTVYKAIAYLGYDLEIESYSRLMEELENGKADNKD